MDETMGRSWARMDTDRLAINGSRIQGSSFAIDKQTMTSAYIHRDSVGGSLPVNSLPCEDDSVGCR